ncbi:MAG: EamA family transporter [Armatimonadota bacterium]|nr:EamA family transporter [Armatimonadota bacterium]MDR5674876.1 EamA family transporter [Armatimonadota bacterium]MDR5688343.1 EamA family transporter [Armatimonadota bacterium]MDR7388244.1 EamA family transporter [Armatimonadota bacterium]MDR7391741.1 EamA family transporter [Armatimonadota bacterium]
MSLTGRAAPSRAAGYAAVLLAASLWGVSGAVAKTLFAEQVAPHTLVAIRLWGAAAVAVLYAGSLRPGGLRDAWARRWRVGLLGVCLSGTQFAYYAAIASADVATAIFLQYLAPVLLVVWARLAEGDPMTPSRTATVALALSGAFLLVAGPRGLLVTPAGLGWGLASAVLFAAYTVLARREVLHSDSWGVLALALAAGAVAWSLVVPPWEAWLRPYTATQWLRFLHLAVLATVLPFGLFLYGLRAVAPARASLLATWEPVVAALSAHLLLQERLTALQAAGATFILAAVLWTNWEGLRGAGPRWPAPD